MIMRDLTQKRQRFLRHPWPVRLGHLASNLARIGDLARQPQTEPLLPELLRESAWFIEWSTDEIPLSILVRLADLQRELTRWRQAQPLGAARSVLAFRAHAMSDEVLELSGLLNSGEQERG